MLIWDFKIMNMLNPKPVTDPDMLRLTDVKESKETSPINNPSDRDIQLYATFLCFDRDNYPDISTKYAKEAISTPLPKNWKRYTVIKTNQTVYYNNGQFHRH